MPTRRPRKTTTLATQAAELAVAAPQVVAHRLTRMAMAGPLLSARDRQEFHLMGTEKAEAFGQAWAAMAAQAAVAGQALTGAWLQALTAPPGRGVATTTALASQWQGAALGVLNKGMAPVHRKAVANAKRLAKTRLK